MELMSPHLQNRNAPSKNCTVSGCDGKMTLDTSEGVGDGARNQEGSGAKWVCDNDPSHTEPAE
jgi:hypothetical protein